MLQLMREFSALVCLSFGKSECRQLVASPGFVVRRGKDANYVIMGTHGGLQGWGQLLLDD